VANAVAPKDMKISICSYPRLHFSLIDLSADGYRMYGGVGMAISAFPIALTFEPSQTTDLSVLKLFRFNDIEIKTLEELARSVMHTRSLKRGIRLISSSPITRNYGLGTSTRIALSLVEALLILNEEVATMESILRLSGRGGASGIGAHTYFHGGACLDIGRRRDGQGFASSEARGPSSDRPLVVGVTAVPDWPLQILLPRLPAVSPEIENAYFSTATPLSKEAVHEAAYVSLFGVFGGIASSDYPVFCRALNRLQALPWKRGEISLHGDELLKIIQYANENGADAVAMSSFGPTLACFGAVREAGLGVIVEKQQIINTRPRNAGREISLA